MAWYVPWHTCIDKDIQIIVFYKIPFFYGYNLPIIIRVERRGVC